MIQNDLIIQSAKILKTLNDLGYDCVAEDDFDTIPDKVFEFGKPFQSPPFENLRNDFTKGQAFWAFLMKDGERVGGLAAQCQDLRGERFDKFMIRTARGQYGGGQTAIEWVSPAATEVMNGKLIYVGELFFSEAARGSRRVLTAFARLSLILMKMTWPDFDWIYAFVPREQARFADYYAFTYRLPQAVKWADPEPRGRASDHFLVGVNARDFEHFLTCGELSKF
ncbi:hypothetical protein RXV86_19630 [Alisedimentitalea sp. MJ-SS2]|uniref:hypothetical protein n=1 Tax=Aliisedimentitalea sp. MJ-SS2 TaxID=3049795 RepID=UPI00290F8927|nr:hypothetical protein [Alisedimentitalea sp. MJ-SS2]MDU8929607.1 hypothetical protein [Alisedimentitalea sp. MJ-SS2]